MYKILFNQIIDRFYSKKRAKFYSLFLFSLIAGLFEYMGLILIFQFVLFLSNPTSEYCVKIISFFSKYLNINSTSKISLILGITIALIYIFKNIYMLLFTKFNNEILQDLSTKITVSIVRKLLFQDYLKTKLTTNEDKINVIAKVNFVVWQYCHKFVNLVINIIIAIILLAYLFIKFTLPAIVATLFISILSFIEYKYLKKNSNIQNKRFSTSFDELNSLILKTVNSIKEIKLNNKGKEYVDDIELKAVDYSKLNKDRSFCDIFHIYFTEISVMFSFILVLCTLFYTTNFNNQLLITSISTICVIILRLTPVINRAQSCLYSINSNRNLAIELLKFDDLFDKNYDYNFSSEVLNFDKSIELKNISFSYSDEIGLNDINLKINKGEFVGIVGKSGCYKTTLSLIISGLIKPQKGMILVDDKQLTKEKYQAWSNNISLLSQDYSLLFDHISDIDSTYIKKLGIDKFNSNVSELSFGEKQRVALANILSNDKNVLILDEISSSCDVLSEEKINLILEELKGSKTIISIAHRLQILKHCDRIIYMENGKIIDIDTFKNLSIKYDDFKKIVELSNFSV